MKILILGKGYIGEALATAPNWVYRKGQRSGQGHDIIWKSKSELDYTDKKIFESYLIAERPDWVINASGYTGRPNVDACEDNRDSTWYYNVTVPKMLGALCAETHHSCVSGSFNTKFIQISSGCIYTGYEKAFTETDDPNFGLQQLNSSWYSKTKHAGELALYGIPGTYIFRIRMPFCETASSRNILLKLLKYDNIINQKNSLTNVEDLVNFIYKFVEPACNYPNRKGLYPYPPPTGIYNVVNPDPVSTAMIVNLLKHYGYENPNWRYIELDELYEKYARAERSNCVLSSDKISRLGLTLPDTRSSLKRAISSFQTLGIEHNEVTTA